PGAAFASTNAEATIVLPGTALRGTRGMPPGMPERAARFGCTLPAMSIAALQDFRLPDLRFLDIDALRPHERADSQRLTPLLGRLRSEAVLHNPPIVAPLTHDASEARFVVLDGANRVSAVRAAG